MGLRAMLRTVSVDAPPAPKAVLSWLAHHADDDDPDLLCFPSIQTLCDETGLHRATVIRAIDRLEDCGWLSRQVTPGSVTYYYLHLPPAGDTRRTVRPVAQCDQSQSATGIASAAPQGGSPAPRITIDALAAVPPVAECDPSQSATRRTTRPVAECDPENHSSRDSREVSTTSRTRALQTDNDPIVAVIPLRDGTDYEIPHSQWQHWQSLFPDVNVAAALGAMRAWSESNPTKRKTRRGVGRFVTAWLTRDLREGRNLRTPGRGAATGGGSPAGGRASPEGDASVDDDGDASNYGGSTDEAIAAFDRLIRGSGGSGGSDHHQGA